MKDRQQQKTMKHRQQQKTTMKRRQQPKTTMKRKITKEIKFKANEKIFALYLSVPYEAIILNVKKDKYYVKYIGWSSHFNEWLPKNRILKNNSQNKKFYKEYFKFCVHDTVFFKHQKNLMKGMVDRVVMSKQKPQYYVRGIFKDKIQDSRLLVEGRLKKYHYRLDQQVRNEALKNLQKNFFPGNFFFF